MIFPRAVFFDLFGTLVAPFRRREHELAIRACARTLGIDHEKCQQKWVETFKRRTRGEFATVADNFELIGKEATGRVLSRALLNSAENIYLDFTAEGLRPLPGALEVLDWLRTRAVPLVLVSNCAPDVPRVWPRSDLARYFEHCVFSCQVKAVKPEREIYLEAIGHVGLDPEEILYVGDGSDEELTGAAACGLRPVLVSADLSNTYDNQRVDTITWSGPRIDELSELPAFFGSADNVPSH